MIYDDDDQTPEERVMEILEDIKNEELNTIVIGACSARAMVDAFRIGVPILERVNLREHVVWSHEPNDEATQLLAEDYMRLGIPLNIGVSVLAALLIPLFWSF